MFNPSKDRLDYSERLNPPAGYETIFAVGTTYSLDLDALIGIGIALGLSESVDSELREDPIYLLEAVQKISDKVLVFCEGGQIKSPNIGNKLHIFLEDMIVEIIMKNQKSFHPKFWLIKYGNESGRHIYRCIVLSRNLTFDRSWDVAISIEGEYKKDYVLRKEYNKSKPLSDFLKALISLDKREEMDSHKKEILLDLSREILNIKFELISEDFTDYSFLPVGIEGYPIDNTNIFSPYDELFMITPFLSSSIIAKFNNLSSNDSFPNTLITRKSELYKLKPKSTNNFNVYALKDIIVDGENVISEGEGKIEKDLDLIYDNNQGLELGNVRNQDIHAKLYLKMKRNNYSELYLGSLNASYSACYGNIEFIFKLYGEKSKLNVEGLKSDIFGEDERENPFEIVEIKPREEPNKTAMDDLEKIIKQISRLKTSASIMDEGEKYSVNIYFEDPKEFKNVYIRPLLSKKEKKISNHILIEDLTILQLSEFYIIKAYSEFESIERIIKIKTDNMPEARKSSVVNNIIKDEKGFIQYITFILGDDYLLSMLENTKRGEHSSMFGSGVEVPALYEKMLKSAVHSPKKFKEIKQLLEIISDDKIIPKGFKELYEVFEKVVNKDEEKLDKN